MVVHDGVGGAVATRFLSQDLVSCRSNGEIETAASTVRVGSNDRVVLRTGAVAGDGVHLITVDVGIVVGVVGRYATDIVAVVDIDHLGFHFFDCLGNFN